MSANFPNMANNVVCIKRFQKNCITPELLDSKKKEYHENKFKRYFLNHKGRTFFMILCIMILFICAMTEYPIDGSINSSDQFSKFMSILGFISANVFMALLFTILGVETYMSREELNEINSYLPNAIESEINKNKNDPEFRNYLRKLVKNLSGKNLNKKEEIYNNNGKVSIGGADNSITDIYEIIDQFSIEQKNKLYKELRKYKKSIGLNSENSPRLSDISDSSNIQN